MSKAVLYKKRLAFEDYLAIDAVNQSSLKQMARSPAHYKHYIDTEHEPTPAQIMGSAIDALVFLEGHEKFTEDPMPGSKKKRP